MTYAYFRFVLAGLLALAQPVAAQLTPQLAQALQQELDNARRQYNAHGLTAAVLLPDQSIWTGAAGMSATAPPDSLRSNYLLGIGSISKTFTAALILRLVGQGRIGLDDSIARHFPQVRNYRNIDPGVTIRQLLNHTGGVFNYTDNPFFAQQVTANPNAVWRPGQILSLVQPMRFVPGAAWEYSNTGYALLGIVVQNKLGLSLSAAYRTLLDPLQLTSTWLGYNDTLPANLTVAHGWIQSATNGPFDVDLGQFSRNSFFSSAYAAGALLSTPTDLVRWGRALYADTTVLTAALRDTMLTVAPQSLNQLPYGLGVMRTTRSGRVGWGHNGSIPGYMATLVYVPACGVAVAVMVNESNPVTEATTNRLFAIINQRVCTVLGLAETAALLAPALYPNPASQQATVRYTCPAEARQVELVLNNALGARVRSLRLSVHTAEASVSLAGLPTGVYAVRLLIDGRAGATTRLVVQP